MAILHGQVAVLMPMLSLVQCGCRAPLCRVLSVMSTVLVCRENESKEHFEASGDAPERPLWHRAQQRMFAEQYLGVAGELVCQTLA